MLSTCNWLQWVFVRGWTGSDLVLASSLFLPVQVQEDNRRRHPVHCSVQFYPGAYVFWSRFHLPTELFMSRALSWWVLTWTRGVAHRRRFLSTKVILLLEKQGCLRNQILTAFSALFVSRWGWGRLGVAFPVGEIDPLTEHSRLFLTLTQSSFLGISSSHQRFMEFLPPAGHVFMKSVLWTSCLFMYHWQIYYQRMLFFCWS